VAAGTRLPGITRLRDYWNAQHVADEVRRTVGTGVTRETQGGVSTPAQ
jgi:hypothetical protein